MQKTIFVVDDSITNLSVAEEALEKQYRVLTFTSAPKMFALLESVMPDLILLDVAMPEVSGFDALKRLKDDKRYAGIPVIFLTALQDSYNEAYGFELGAVDFITKPFSEIVLMRRVKNHLDIDQLVHERTASLEKAMSASTAKSNFLSNMSHEMRTPLNAIIGMTALGKRSGDLDGKNHALNKIGDASSHLLGVINDILDMAKIEANKLELLLTEFNFDRLLQKAAMMVNFRIDEKHQEFTVKVDSKIPRFIIGDEQRLAQVVTNLLSNAVKFTPEGGKIHLEAALVEEVDGVCEIRIEVADNGIGIPLDKQEKLFRVFEQAECGTSRKYGGTGLGLAIVKSITEMMGGKIWLESELGKGARFVFTIKAQRGKEKPRAQLSPDVNWENVRILAVDDVPETRRQFQEIFGMLEITCDVAADGLEACSLIEERGEYDMYFVDWQMPLMDGVELTKYIKSRGSGRPSVITLITSQDFELIRNESQAAGIDRHLLKPLFASMIIDIMNEYLGAARGLPENMEAINDEFAGKKMLLAEDIEINREILVALLENTGLAIDCAETGKQALEKIEAAPDKYDIVLMDVQMPEMDGLEATKRIRELPAIQKSKLPIIAMTANIFREDIEACLAAGMDGHLGKPLDMDKVLETLRKYLLGAS